MAEKTYRVGLIGCGRMGATIDDEVRDRPNSYLWLPYSHAAGVVACDRAELVTVSDVDSEKAETIRERYGARTCYTDYREMIEKEALDIVCIATRPATHAEMTVFAAEHGVKGIYCEKPLCCSMAEADAMVSACTTHGVKFNYGAQRRYAPLYRKMRELADAGELGTVQAVIVEQGTSAAMWGLTHGSDMMLYLAGDPEVEFVQGTILCEDEDWDGDCLGTDPGVASGYVKFSNGIHGYFTAAGGTEFEVSGTTGKVRSTSNGMGWQLRKQTDVTFEMAESDLPEVSFGAGTDRGIYDLAEALDTGRDTQSPLEVARRSQEVLMGIIESHRQGGARVPLPMANRDLYIGKKGW